MRFEILNRLRLGIALYFGTLFAAQAKAHLADGHRGHARCGAGDARKVAPLQHQLGRTLPAADLAVLAVTRVQTKVAGAHIHLPWLSVAARFQQGRIQRLAQLPLHHGSVLALARGAQGEHQQILLHIHRPSR